MSLPPNDDSEQTCFRNMAFVHRQSCEGVKSELDIFAVPPTQTSIEDGRWVEHQPLTSLDSGGPIEFVIPGTGDAYLDLANTYLLIRAKVVRGVGTDLAADTPVAPVNNWLHSLFSQVDVYLNDTLVTPSSNTYPFRAYVDTVLSYGAEAKNTQLTSQLWYKDTAGHMDATTVDGGNTGLIERQRHIAESRIVEMMGRLHVDLFLQDRFLLNGVSVKIRLVRSKIRLLADGWWSKPRLQGEDSGRCIVRTQGCVEPDCSNGSHKSLGKRDSQISDTSRGLQSLLHSTRCHVAHAREPVPRDAAEATNIVVHRQQCLQRRIL